MGGNVTISRRQRVFAAKEAESGVLTFPVAGDFIRPAGDATVNQTPKFTDSTEKRDTLDLLDQFQDALPPGEWSLPTLVRPAGAFSLAPQGSVLFECLQGVRNPATTMSLAASIASDSAISAEFTDLSGGKLPTKGVVQLGDELMAYDSFSEEEGTITLSGLSRGHGGTTAASHDAPATAELKSLAYFQATDSPSFSLWVETDHMVQFLSGCTVNQATLGVNNQGAVSLNYQGQGMKMGWAGTSSVETTANVGAGTVTVADARKYTPGARIMNPDAEDDNAGAGYVVDSVDVEAGALTLSPALAVQWTSGQTVKGFLPEASATGAPLESRRTRVLVDGVAARFRSADLSFSTPKNYPTDEVGADGPAFYMEDARRITSDFGLYFRSDDLKYFHDGYDGNEVPIEIIFGEEPGSTMRVYLRRCRLQVPTVNFEAPAVAISMPLTALGETGEDSCEIVFE